MFCLRSTLLFCFLKYFLLVNKPDSSLESTFACSVVLFTHCPTPRSVVKPLMIPQCIKETCPKNHTSHLQPHHHGQDQRVDQGRQRYNCRPAQGWNGLQNHRQAAW